MHTDRLAYCATEGTGIVFPVIKDWHLFVVHRKCGVFSPFLVYVLNIYLHIILHIIEIHSSLALVMNFESMHSKQLVRRNNMYMGGTQCKSQLSKVSLFVHVFFLCSCCRKPLHWFPNDLSFKVLKVSDEIIEYSTTSYFSLEFT